MGPDFTEIGAWWLMAKPAIRVLSLFGRFLVFSASFHEAHEELDQKKAGDLRAGQFDIPSSWT